MAAAAADKARFYLEQSVPELQALSQKGIFTSSEIKSITSKRSTYEHKINMPSSSSSTSILDYLSYFNYERILLQLRSKRSTRLSTSISSSTIHSATKRMYGILERGIRKFPGDDRLWMTYLNFCSEQNSRTKLAKGLTKALRLNPTNWALWCWAAAYYLDKEGDITVARGYMTRGIRFCGGKSKGIWIGYLDLEMGYLSKICRRRMILGLDQAKKEEKEVEDSEMGDEDEIALPSLTAEDINPELKQDINQMEAKIKELSNSPALNGAIPIAIIQAASKSFNPDCLFLEELFDCVAKYTEVACLNKILQSIIDLITTTTSSKYANLILASLKARLQIIGVKPDDTSFPALLSQSLSVMNEIETPDQLSQTMQHIRFIVLALQYIQSIKVDGLSVDQDIQTVLEMTIKQHIGALTQLYNNDLTSKEGQKCSKLLLERVGRQTIQKQLMVSYLPVDWQKSLSL